MTPTALLAALVFAHTYLVLGIGALPPLRLDRARLWGYARVGAPVTLLTLVWDVLWLCA